MTKILTKLLFILLDISLFIALLFSILQLVVYNDTYFRWHYETHEISETTGMSVDALMEVTDKMMDFLIDKRDTLNMTAVIDGQNEEVFGDREKAHMDDVKTLFIQGKLLRDVGAVFLLLSLLYLSKTRKELFLQWLKQLKVFFVSSFMIIAVLGGLFAADFNKYFTLFHELFFDNDLWLLDPRTDILINMVPEIFFFQTVMIIIVGFVLSIFGILMVSKSILKKHLDQYIYNTYE